MVDYYALPATGDGAWPHRAEASRLPFPDKAKAVENAMLADICFALGEPPDTCRFIPFVMMHEFEAVLFSDCPRFGNAIGRPETVGRMQAIRNAFPTPEHINDSPETCPSKRILDIVPGYEKPLFGSLAALEIGVERISEECPHFAQWLGRLIAKLG